jgi:hypothetical protein
MAGNIRDLPNSHNPLLWKEGNPHGLVYGMTLLLPTIHRSIVDSLLRPGNQRFALRHFKFVTKE